MRRLRLPSWLLTATTVAVAACQNGNNLDDTISDWPPRSRAGSQGPISDWPTPMRPARPTDEDEDDGAEGPVSDPSFDSWDAGQAEPPRSADVPATAADAGAPDTGVIDDAGADTGADI